MLPDAKLLNLSRKPGKAASRKVAAGKNAIPPRTWSAKEARENFADVLDAAERGAPQRISRRGKAAFVLVSEADWVKSQPAIAEAAAFVEHLLAFPAVDDDFFLPRGEADRPVIDFSSEAAG